MSERNRVTVPWVLGPVLHSWCLSAYHRRIGTMILHSSALSKKTSYKQDEGEYRNVHLCQLQWLSVSHLQEFCGRQIYIGAHNPKAGAKVLGAQLCNRTSKYCTISNWKKESSRWLKAGKDTNSRQKGNKRHLFIYECSDHIKNALHTGCNNSTLKDFKMWCKLWLQS